MGAAQSASVPYTLHTATATYHGVEQSSSDNKPVLRRFTRIPYAKPPVGPLRFRRPQPLQASNISGNGAMIKADDTDGANGDDSSSKTQADTSFGPMAPQPIYTSGSAFVDPPKDAAEPQDEDCLYLNIWVPLTDTIPVGGWPVQFHIHGGWLQVGSANTGADADPFDLFESTNLTNRIIVSPTYRLNILGFAGGHDLTETAQAEGDSFAGNYGLWDQRMALEWVYTNIADFGGNPKRLTVGGLSAGAHSALMQLYHDSFLPVDQRIISQVYLWSNALAVQPSATDSQLLTDQFNELCEAVGIKNAKELESRLKVDQLRKIGSQTLIDAISKLKMHTFRSSTDGPIEAGGFLPPTYLSSLKDGTFATRLAERRVRIMIGEVKDEGELYKLIHPPKSVEGLKVQLGNYYPAHVVDALIKLPVYGVSGLQQQVTANKANGDNAIDKIQDKKKWADVFGKIAADCQVHVSTRGLARSLLHPPGGPNIKAMDPNKLYRYRICWRAKCLDATLKPEVGVCHAADTPIWWVSGWRAGFTDEDKASTEEFLRPFGKFLEGDEDIGWGGAGGVDVVRLLDEDGRVHEGVKDEDWERAMEVWDAVQKAQLKLPVVDESASAAATDAATDDAAATATTPDPSLTTATATATDDSRDHSAYPFTDSRRERNEMS